MKDFLKDENQTPDVPEVDTKAEDGVTYEENDNWKFEAEAPTLNSTVLENDELEIAIPKAKPAPASKPAAKATTAAPKPAKKKSGNTALFVVTSILTAAIIGVLIWLGICYYTVPNTDEKMNPGNVALTVGETDVSIGMYNYYYTCIYQNYASMAQNGYNNLDVSQDFSQQKTTDENGKETTWDKLFVNSTIDQIKFITAYYEAAVKDGVTLTAEQKEQINTDLANFKTSASESDMSVDEYISQQYGDYCGYATLKKMITQCYVAENYFQKHSVETKVSEKEVQKYFNKHSDDYTKVPIAYLQMSYDPQKPATQKKAEEKAAKYVKQIKTIDDMKKLVPDACDDLIKQYIDAGYFQNKDEAVEMIADNMETELTKSDQTFVQDGIDWLFSDKTKVGDSSYFVDADNSLIFVLLKTGDQTVDDSDSYSVRHILIMPESKNADEDEAAPQTEFTKEEWAAAKKKADKIYKQYLAGDKTEYSFALLAEKYSSDVESTSNGSSGIFGGLYANVPLGQMVPSFEQWSVDDARKYGDVEIVESDYGYHIMFFVEKTKSYLYACESALLSEKEKNFTQNITVDKHKGAMKKTKVASPETATSADDAAANEADFEDADDVEVVE